MASVEVAPTAQFKPVAAPIPPNQREGRLSLAGAVALSLAIFAIYLIPTALTPGRPAQPQNIELGKVALKMSQAHAYLVPVSEDGKAIAEPPLPYWMSAGVFSLLTALPQASVSLQATHLPVALLASLSVFIAMLFAAQMWNRTASVWCGIFMGLSIGYMRFSQLGLIEIESAFFYLGALLSCAWIVSSPRAGFSTPISLGICLGLALLGGAPLAVVIVLLAAMTEGFFQKGLSGGKIGFIVGALVLAVLTMAPWLHGISNAWTGTESWFTVYLRSAVLESTEAPNLLRHNVLADFLPWTPLLFLGWIGVTARMRSERTPQGADELKWMLARYLLSAAVLSLPLIVAAPWRTGNLLLFIVPFAAASGYMISRLDQPGGVLEEKIAWLQLFWTAALGVAILVAPLWIPHVIGALPARFMLHTWILSGCVGLSLIALAFTGSRQIVEAHGPTAGLHFGVSGVMLLTALTMFVVARHIDDPLSTSLKGQLPPSKSGITITPVDPTFVPQPVTPPVAPTPAPAPTPTPAQ